jgi:peptidyl-prolyl cis-trans isomerase C
MKKLNLNTLLREPLLYFLLIGAALFIIYDLQNENVSNNKRIVISEVQVDHLITLWEKNRQRLPTQVELQGMIEQQIREEVMYREALAMGLDKNDRIVRRRLAQKVEFISADLATLVEPTDAELQDYLATNSEQFILPARINFEHVYINTSKHKNNVEAYAKRLLNELTQASSDVDINTIGDSLLLDQQYEKQTEHDVSRLFGESFASKLFTLPAGNWQGPVQSGYGFHLVRINNKTENQQPELYTVRAKVRLEWLSQQRREMDKIFYNSLRQRYEIVVEKTLIKASVANTKP